VNCQRYRTDGHRIYTRIEFWSGLRGVSTAVNNRNLSISLAARYRIPFRFFVADGGVISYGADPINFYRQAAGYVDRILKGEKPADRPVQAATKVRIGDQSQNSQDTRYFIFVISTFPR